MRVGHNDINNDPLALTLSLNVSFHESGTPIRESKWHFQALTDEALLRDPNGSGADPLTLVWSSGHCNPPVGVLTQLWIDQVCEGIGSQNLFSQDIDLCHWR